MVEDEFTRLYLEQLWQDTYIAFIVAGSCSAVRPMIEMIRSHGHTLAFGVQDRDFRQSNQDNWNQRPPVDVFILPRHEIENYLLDSDALHQIILNTRNRARADIEQRLTTTANSMCWWMACRKVLTDLGMETCDQFPAHPSRQNVANQQQAETYICANPWVTGLEQKAHDLLRTASIRQRLNQAHTVFSNEANNNSWRRTFSGKEILNVAREYVYQNTGVPVTKQDWAIEIGRWQSANGAIPADLEQLHDELIDILTAPP